VANRNRLEAPAVDDVTHQVQLIAGVGREELEQRVGTATARTQMNVREKDRAVVGLGGGSTVLYSCRRSVFAGCGDAMTAP